MSNATMSNATMSNAIVRKAIGPAPAWARRVIRTLATAVAATLPALVAAAGLALAQTPKTTPKPRPDLFQTPDATKPAPAKQTRSCSSYGDGFVNMPGTDTCVKAGGYMRMDAGGSR